MVLCGCGCGQPVRYSRYRPAKYATLLCRELAKLTRERAARHARVKGPCDYCGGPVGVGRTRFCCDVCGYEGKKVAAKAIRANKKWEEFYRENNTQGLTGRQIDNAFEDWR